MDISEKAGLLQIPAPSYQNPPENPNTGYPSSGTHPYSSGYPGQQYGTSGYPHAQGSYPGQPAVTVQPAVYVSPTPLVYPVPDYMAYSIFVMLCCCLPVGIAALVYSCSTRDAIMSGHQQLAEKNSRMARILNHVGLGIGLACTALWIVVMVVYFKKTR